MSIDLSAFIADMQRARETGLFGRERSDRVSVDREAMTSLLAELSYLRGYVGNAPIDPAPPSP